MILETLNQRKLNGLVIMMTYAPCAYWTFFFLFTTLTHTSSQPNHRTTSADGRSPWCAQLVNYCHVICLFTNLLANCFPNVYCSSLSEMRRRRRWRRPNNFMAHLHGMTRYVYALTFAYFSKSQWSDKEKKSQKKIPKNILCISIFNRQTINSSVTVRVGQ